jgi:hypothetical protein
MTHPSLVLSLVFALWAGAPATQPTGTAPGPASLACLPAPPPAGALADTLLVDLRYDNCTTCGSARVTCAFACRFFGGVGDFQCDPASPCDYTCICADGNPP